MLRSTDSTVIPKSSLLIVIALAIAMLYFGRQVLIPLALSLVLSFLLTPLVELLERCHLGRALSVVVVLVLGFAIAAGIGWGVADQLVEITSHIGDYKENVEEKIQSLHAPKGERLSQATATVQELNKELAAAPEAAQKAAQPKQPDGSSHPSHPIPVEIAAPPSNFLQNLRTLLGPLAGPLETGGIVIVFTAFTLAKREDLRNRLIRLAGQGRLNVMTQVLDDASRRLSRYLMFLFLVNASYGGLFGLGLYLIGVPHALLWGALAALLRFVPYIGTLIATAFPIAMAMAVSPGWKQVLLTFALFAVLEILISNLLEPYLYGSHTGISSLGILVVAVFWSILWGPVGLILSTPLTVCLVLLGRYVPQLRFIEVMLGDEPVLKPEELFYQRLLAMDADDARKIAEDYLRDHSLENLYESLLIPALGLSEQDRHRYALEENVSKFIHQSFRELIEDLGDRYTEQQAKEKVDAYKDQDKEKNDADETAQKIHDPEIINRFRGVPTVCIPGRDEADELIGLMLCQLLQLTGIDANYLAIGAVDEMLGQTTQRGARIVCVSALPPLAIGQARSLCRKLHARNPDVSVILGLWSFAGGVPIAQEQVGPNCAFAIATTLAEAQIHIRSLIESTFVQSQPREAEVLARQ